VRIARRIAIRAAPGGRSRTRRCRDKGGQDGGLGIPFLVAQFRRSVRRNAIAAAGTC
jgi:hypothetical protein